jgi:hypothetical protein
MFMMNETHGRVLGMKNGLHIEHDGSRCWYLDDKLHREDGPAEEWADGSNSWHLNDNYLGDDDEGFWAHWEQLTHTQRCNLNLHFWLAKYST